VTIHIYRETAQPATRFVDHHMDPPMVFTFHERRQAWCERCWRKRWMGKLLVGTRVVLDDVFAENACVHLEDLGNSWMLIISVDGGFVHLDLPKSPRKDGDALVCEPIRAACTLDGVATKARLT